MKILGALALATTCGLTATGCELAPPDASRPARPRTETLEVAPPDATAATPLAALRRVALASGNWTAETIDLAFRRAEALSVGAARAELVHQAAEIRAGLAAAPLGFRSRTTVEGVILRGAGQRRNAIVVTRTIMTGGGIRGEGREYTVTLATLDRSGQGWAISRWSPER
jgi:hypothetical protein